MITDAQARKAQKRDKDYKIADSGGLYLLVKRTGTKCWRLKYRMHGREKLLAFGTYPEVSLTEARGRRDAARGQLRESRDPSIERRKAQLAAAAAAADTFEAEARAWWEQERGRWAPRHAADVLTSLERDVFPKLGNLPLAEIDTPLVLDALRPVEARGAGESARRLRQRISAVFLRAIGQGKVGADPAPATITKAMKPLPRKGKQPALTDAAELRRLLRDAEGSGASPVTKLASRALALTAVRPGVVAGAFAWAELEGVDWDEPAGPGSHPEALWRIPSERMKLVLDRKGEVAFEHLVPLSWQAVAVFQTIRRLTGRAPFVFPGQRHAHRPISANAIGYLYNRCGYNGRHVPHGWRAGFSTIMNEKAEREGRLTDAKAIDLQLGHVPKDKVEGAYNRAAFLPRRRELMQEWADLLLEGLRPASDLLTGPRRGG
ncbi:MAG: tyrosine-type recombinase/integrase [Allosphingosinicella sp.]